MRSIGSGRAPQSLLQRGGPQERTTSDGAPLDQAGWSVALSADGTSALSSADVKTVGSTTTQGPADVVTCSGHCTGYFPHLLDRDERYARPPLTLSYPDHIRRMLFWRRWFVYGHA